MFLELLYFCGTTCIEFSKNVPNFSVGLLMKSSFFPFTYPIYMIYPPINSIFYSSRKVQGRRSLISLRDPFKEYKKKKKTTYVKN